MKVISIIIILGFLSGSCNNSELNPHEEKLKLQIAQQQKLIDSLKSVRNVSSNDVIEKIQDHQKRSTGFDPDKISDGRNISPVMILKAETQSTSDFAGICVLQIQNSYKYSTTAILIDIGISKKKINCKVGAKSIANCKIYLTQDEMEHFMPVSINGQMEGLRVEKIVFQNGHEWRHFKSRL